MMFHDVLCAVPVRDTRCSPNLALKNLKKSQLMTFLYIRKKPTQVHDFPLPVLKKPLLEPGWLVPWHPKPSLGPLFLQVIASEAHRKGTISERDLQLPRLENDHTWCDMPVDVEFLAAAWPKHGHPQWKSMLVLKGIRGICGGSPV